MPFCPECRDEYREGITRCASCSVELVGSLDAVADDELLELEKRLASEELTPVFAGDLDNCKTRNRVLAEHGIPALITGDLEATETETLSPYMYVQCATEDVEDVAAIFQELWNESLSTEGIQVDEADAVDMEAEEIECPGCSTVISELTVEGECPECGLFLGYDEEVEEEEEE